jgi:IS1 transposase
MWAWKGALVRADRPISASRNRYEYEWNRYALQHISAPLLLRPLYQGVIPAVQHRAIHKLARKTNHIERFNNTLRQRVSRLVREGLSFSKKLAHHIGAIKLFICHYNLMRAVA